MPDKIRSLSPILQKALEYALSLKTIGMGSGKVFTFRESIYIELKNKTLYNHKFGYTIDKKYMKDFKRKAEVHNV